MNTIPPGSDSTLSLLTELLAIPSVTPDDHGCQEKISARLQNSGFVCESINFNQTKNLWAKLGTGKPLLCFAGHTDVVPPGELTAWQSPPFIPTVRAGKVYGRGAADMKSGLAAFITAIERFVAENPAFCGSLAVLLTSDEEGDNVDGMPRVVDLLQRRGEKIDYCLVAEPTSVTVLGDTVKNGRRGTLSGHLLIKGKQGHIAYPDTAKNPIHLVLPALQDLLAYQWDEGDAFFPPTGLQFSNIHAGLGVGNVIPGVLELKFNFRYSPEQSAASLQKKVKAILHRHALDFTLSWQAAGKPFITPPGRLTQTVCRVIAAELGVKSTLNTTGGTSDGRFIKAIARELVEFGPVNASIHQIDEHVNLADVTRLSLVYEQIIRDLLLPEQDRNSKDS